VVGVTDELEVGDFDAEGLVADGVLVDINVEDPEEDAKLDVSIYELLDDVRIDFVACTDPDDSDDCSTLVSLGSPVTDAVTPVGNVALAGGAAVAGPK